MNTIFRTQSTRSRTAALLSIWGLALAACAPTNAPNIRPIEDILVSGPDFIVLSPDSATVEAETSLAVACAVVYGTTPAYGSIATDMDMAGGGHTDHHPILAGLQPDTLYYARLQGVGPDGALYRSEEYTFRTPAAAQAGGEGNLASREAGARIVGVSSTFGGGADDSSFGSLNAIDGSPGTQWSSDGDGDEAWIEIELAAESHITRVGLWTRTMGSSAQIESFQIVTDGGETIGPFELPDAAQPYTFDTDFAARRLRFEVVTSSGGNTGVVDIEVYGESGAGTEP